VRSYKNYFLLACLLFSGLISRAQNLTGTWEGTMSQEELQINIVQEKNDEICGYTYDYFKYNPRDYCKAYFKGYYNKRQEAWELTGVSFLENSGTHVLMRIKLYKDKIDGETVLLALVTAKSALGFFLGGGIRENAILRKVSSKPAKLPGNMPPCFPDPEKPVEKPIDKPVQKPAPEKPRPTDSPVVKPDPVKKPVDSQRVVRRDTLVTSPQLPVEKPVEKKVPEPVIKEVKERKNVTFSEIPVTVKNINLKVYDNAVVDGDTVSIYYNGRLLVNRKKLTEKPIEIDLELDENATRHEILLFAHNLGSIPPNTALIVVNAGEKRYELHSKADLKENAVLVFTYAPK